MIRHDVQPPTSGYDMQPPVDITDMQPPPTNKTDVQLPTY